MAKPIPWCEDSVVGLLESKGHEFARIATPRGWRTSGLKHLLPSGKKRLEGNCFQVSMHLALLLSDQFYYCEGYAAGLPHAWISPKKWYDSNREGQWCVDLTWPFFTRRRGQYRVHDDYHYCGVCFEPEVAYAAQQERLKRVGPGVFTSVSLLMHLEEYEHLVVC